MTGDTTQHGTAKPVPGEGGATATLAQRWPEADHQQRRDLIVSCALQLLHEYGRSAVTMRRVASQLGVGAMTLYTYFASQDELWRGVVRRGFELLHCQCEAANPSPGRESWRAGARQYLNFALEHPNLYKLMFDAPVVDDDSDILEGGFEALLDKVRNAFGEQGLQGKQLEQEARRAAGRYWIGLHGLAMLAIAQRLCVLEGDLDALLDDLLPRIAPT